MMRYLLVMTKITYESKILLAMSEKPRSLTKPMKPLKVWASLKVFRNQVQGT